MLSHEGVSLYQAQGFALIPDFSPPDECSALRERAAAMLAAFDPASASYSIFSATNNRHIQDANFMESTDGIRFFFEESAFSPEGRLICDKSQAIFKIGHALHDYDPLFRDFSHSPRMHQIARCLGYKRPLIGQSRYFFKLPGLRGKVFAHQDSTVLYTEPPSCSGLWLALEDATRENGCIWAIPGSHRDGLRFRKIRDVVSGEGRIEAIGTFAPWDDASFIPLEVKAGTAVLLHGELVHKSTENISTVSRQAYSLHFIEGDESHQYPTQNWLQRPGGFGELRGY